MRVTFRKEADPFERYAPGSWDSAVGRPVAVPPGGTPGRIVAAEVVEDGTAVDLTVEVDLLGFDPLSGLSIDPDGEDGAQ